MGLFDSLRRVLDALADEPPPPTPPPLTVPPAPVVDAVKEWEARGRLEAKVNTLELEWAAYRDQINKLVQRLEKRDQRAAAREQREVEEEAGPAPDFDELEGWRAIRERRVNAVLRSR